MEVNIKDFEIKNTTKCECGHQFVIQDITELTRIGQNGFYGNIVKHCSYTKCPKCQKETLLLLKQNGQTYDVLDIALKKVKNIENKVNMSIEEENATTKEFICPECQKVCKNQLGLNAHMRTHNK